MVLPPSYPRLAPTRLEIALPDSATPPLRYSVTPPSALGLRYPIPQYGIQSDARAGLAVSYGERRGS